MPNEIVLARLRGDEFGALIPGDKLPEINSIAMQISNAIKNAIFMQNFEFESKASIGISIFPADATDGMIFCTPQI